MLAVLLLPFYSQAQDLDQLREYYKDSSFWEMLEPLEFNPRNPLSQKTSLRLRARTSQSFSSTWMTNDSVTYTYAQGTLANQTDSWVPEGFTFVNRGRTLSTFTSFGLVDTLTAFVSISGPFENRARTINTFDSVHNLPDTTTNYTWLFNEWVNNFRDIRRYDSLGRLVYFEDQLWQNNAWLKNRNIITSFNTDGTVDAELREVWEEDSLSWFNESLAEHIYLPNGDLDSVKSYIWQNGNWNRVSLSLYTVNTNGLVIDRVNRSLDLSTMGWINRSRNTYSYTANGDLDTLENFSWSGADSAWVNSSRITYTYDAQSNITSFKFASWSSTMNEYDPSSQILYYYEAFNETSIEDALNPLAHIVYPNPFSEGFTITYNSSTNGPAILEIYNLSGQLIDSKTVPTSQGNITWLGKSQQGVPLPTGVYTYRLRVGETIGRGKIIKIE